MANKHWRNPTQEDNMHILTINLFKHTLALMDTCVENGLVISRSELARQIFGEWELRMRELLANWDKVNSSISAISATDMWIKKAQEQGLI